MCWVLSDNSTNIQSLIFLSLSSSTATHEELNASSPAGQDTDTHHLFLPLSCSSESIWHSIDMLKHFLLHVQWWYFPSIYLFSYTWQWDWRLIEIEWLHICTDSRSTHTTPSCSQQSACPLSAPSEDVIQVKPTILGGECTLLPPHFSNKGDRNSLPGWLLCSKLKCIHDFSILRDNIGERLYFRYNTSVPLIHLYYTDFHATEVLGILKQIPVWSKKWSHSTYILYMKPRFCEWTPLSMLLCNISLSLLRLSCHLWVSRFWVALSSRELFKN